MCCWGTNINHPLIRKTLSVRPAINASSTAYTKILLELAGWSTKKRPTNGETWESAVILQLFLRCYTSLVIHREHDLRLDDARSGPAISQTSRIISWKRISAGGFKIIEDDSQNIGAALRPIASRFGIKTELLSQRAFRIRSGATFGLVRSQNCYTSVQPELIKLFTESQAGLILTIVSHGFTRISSSFLEYCMLADMLRETLASTTIYIIFLMNIRKVKKSPLGLLE